ncbi:hypothetical protein PMAYCL1PPCAC_20921, partial [Pristionchus mayeri]
VAAEEEEVEDADARSRLVVCSNWTATRLWTRTSGRSGDSASGDRPNLPATSPSSRRTTPTSTSRPAVLAVVYLLLARPAATTSRTPRICSRRCSSEWMSAPSIPSPRCISVPPKEE